MNREEFRGLKEYKESVEKIKSYSKGFAFTIPYYKMTKAQQNAMNVITHDCIKDRIIESISIGVSLEGKITEETFMKL